MKNLKPQHQEKLKQACKELEANPKLKILSVARVHGLNDKTLANHWYGRSSFHSEAHATQQHLTEEEEKQLVAWIMTMDDQGSPPRRRHVRDMVEFLLTEKKNTEIERIGKHWTDRFLQRHPEIACKFARPINKYTALD
jgi:mRNA-degrading endonuclease RelE of RelBE toxin-antitoxin system